LTIIATSSRDTNNAIVLRNTFLLFILISFQKYGLLFYRNRRYRTPLIRGLKNDRFKFCGNTGHLYLHMLGTHLKNMGTNIRT